MAELGVVGSAVGVVSLGLQTCHGLLKYYGSWKNGRKDVAAMCDSVESLAKTLTLLDSTASGSSERELNVQSSLAACRSGIEKLEQKLSKVQKVPGPEKLSTKLHDQGRRLLYPFRESTLAKLKEIVSDIRSNLSLAVDTSQLQATVNVSVQVKDLATFIVNQHEDKESQAIINWLSPLNFRETQVDTLSQKQEGTGEWVFDTREFRDWASGTRKLLWCWGQPGAGKTVLASSIISHLETEVLSSDDGLAYVYCNYKDQASQTLPALLASLVQQLVQCSNLIPKNIRDLYHQHRLRNTKPSIDDLSTHLQLLATNFSRTFIVIDALDECQDTDETRSKFITLLLRLVPANLHLLCTSRRLGDIENYFAAASCLEINAMNEDIEIFLTSQVLESKRLRSFCRSSENLQSTIVDRIVNNARGMFLLAKLHIQSLKTKTSSRQVRKALERLPKELNTVYHDAIERIRGQHEEEVQLALRLLSWITHAFRPLKVKELQHAMAVMDFESDENSLSDEDLPAEAVMITVCGGLVVVDQKSRLVRLIHYTTEEYFGNFRDELFPHAQLDIARSCVRYLTMEVFSRDKIRTYDGMKRRREQYPLLKYASINWGNHTRGLPEGKIGHEVLALLSKDALLSTATQTIYHPNDDTEALGLLAAASFGLVTIVNELLKAGTSIQARGRHDETALHVAAMNGHEGIIRLLLERGADIEAQNDDGRTALIEAAASNQETIVRLLLFHGALTTTADFELETALHKAAGGEHESIVSMLCKAGADVRAINIQNETPLLKTAENGNLRIVNYLLNRGSWIDKGDYAGRTLLWKATKFGDEALVALLCNNGASVTAESVDRKSPIHVALEEGCWQIIRLLLDTKSINDTFFSESDGVTTALYLAAKEGYKQGIKLLLDHGANVDSRNGKQNTPLFVAACYGHETVMKLLLGSGADIEAKDLFGRTALHLATTGGYTTGVRLLIENGAKVDTFDQGLVSPLLVAASLGFYSIVKNLLENGADIGILGKSGLTPLHGAVKNSHYAIAKMLLENGARINGSPSVSGNLLSEPSPLLIAVFQEEEPMVKLLIDYGANIWDTNSASIRGSPFISDDRGPRFSLANWPQWLRHEGIAKLLLEQESKESIA